MQTFWGSHWHWQLSCWTQLLDKVSKSMIWLGGAAVLLHSMIGPSFNQRGCALLFFYTHLKIQLQYHHTKFPRVEGQYQIRGNKKELPQPGSHSVISSHSIPPLLVHTAYRKDVSYVFELQDGLASKHLYVFELHDGRFFQIVATKGWYKQGHL